MSVIDMVDGATVTYTLSQGPGLLVMASSMAWLRVSMPLGRFTWSDPTYSAFTTFFGSSMGVGNDWAVERIDSSMECNFSSCTPPQFYIIIYQNIFKMFFIYVNRIQTKTQEVVSKLINLLANETHCHL